MALQLSVERFGVAFAAAYARITDTSFRFTDDGDIAEIVLVVHASAATRQGGAAPIEATAYQIDTLALVAYQEPTDIDPRQPAYRWLTATQYPEAINV